MKACMYLYVCILNRKIYGSITTCDILWNTNRDTCIINDECVISHFVTASSLMHQLLNMYPIFPPPPFPPDTDVATIIMTFITR
jgi:hypothetical protein